MPKPAKLTKAEEDFIRTLPPNQAEYVEIILRAIKEKESEHSKEMTRAHRLHKLEKAANAKLQ
jgi:hypothetical protein